MNIDLVIGGLSGVISRTITAPLELLKMQRQNYFIPNTTIRDVLRKEGIRYLWKGNFTNSLRIFPQYAFNFSAFEYSKKNIVNKIENKNLQNLIAGSIAGTTALSATYPLETLRSRLALQTQKSHYSGLLNAFLKTSLRDKYRGMGMSLIGFTPYNALSFGFFYFYKNKFQTFSLDSNITDLFGGGLAGMSAVSITYPTDLIRRRLQLQGFDKSVPKYDGIVDCFRKIVKYDGFAGLYRGLGACYLKIFPTVAIQFWCIEKGRELLKHKTYMK